MSGRIVAFLIVAAGLIAAALWLQPRLMPDATLASTSPPATDAGTEPRLADHEVTDTVPAPRTPASAAAAGSNRDAGCRPLNVADATHPLVADEIERLSEIWPEGPYFEAYRGLDVATLEGMANTGDSIAMMLLGARSWLAIDSSAPDDPVGHFNRDYSIRSGRSEALPESKQIDLLDQAAHWYYTAALHGRHGALMHYAEVIGKRFPSPVQIGWIDAEIYDSLDSDERGAITPTNVMMKAVLQLTPELRDGLFGLELEKEGAFDETTEHAQRIVDDFLELFVRDRAAAGLRPPLIRPPRYSRDELRRALCLEPAPE